MRILCIVLSITILWGLAVAKKRVCIIGAGRAGLAAVKTVADRIDDFEPIVFEKNSDVGGLWIYTDKIDFDEFGLPVHSTIYKNLRTNLWKGWMTYPDYHKFEDGSDDFYASHEAVLQYLRNYTDHFNLRKYIQFNTLVTKVFPKKSGGDWRTTTWRMKLRNINTDKESTLICDAVMVCNGHLTKPNIPQIPGLENFPGRVLHSRSYRKPEDFTNQTVLLLGSGASGLDIARDLNHHAKLVYLSHRYDDDDPFLERPSNVKILSNVVAANGNHIILQDNSTVVVDAFIYCTGYLYDFPFLDKSSGIVVEKNHVQPLHDNSINMKNPSMAFIGLIEEVHFGDKCYSQSKFFLDLLQGIEDLPSRRRRHYIKH